MVLWANSDLFHVTGEKNKVCKVLQMAWTFVNDRWGFCASGFTAWLVFICKECKVIWWCHNNLVLQRAKTQTTSRVVCSLCTMLSLQWEPEIIAVAVMYLAGRLCKFDIQEWTNKQSTRRWWEQFVQDVPVELLEGTQHKDVPLKASSFVFFIFLSLPKKTCLCLPDICHQILDLYSQGNKPIPQQMQEKERAPAAPISAPPAPQGQPPAANPPPPPPKKTSPQGGSPSRQLKRSHVSIHSACAVQLVFNMIHARGSYFISSVLQTSPKDEPKAPGNMFIND